MKAMVGWVQRQRTSHPLLDEKSCANAEDERSCREECVAQRSERAGDADDQHDDDAGDGTDGRDKADGAAEISAAATEQVSCERECAEQQKRVGEMQRQIGGAKRRLALRRETELDEQRAEDRFNESECNGCYGMPRARDGRAPFRQMSR